MNNRDPTRKYIEAGFEALSLTLGIKSFSDNISAGNYGAATLDGLGVVADGVLAVIPLAPGVVGLSLNASRSAGSKLNKLAPVKGAEGAHSVAKVDPKTGKITRTETYTPNPRNPSGFDKTQSTDVTGKPHTNKTTGVDVPTPHTQGKDIDGGVRPATPEEIPRDK